MARDGRVVGPYKMTSQCTMYRAKEISPRKIMARLRKRDGGRAHRPRRSQADGWSGHSTVPRALLGVVLTVVITLLSRSGS
ncbi:hypothetical protein G3M58_93135 [Streptomyces sp. SID7499]|uniref:Uncharacterized protein n=1 Tax=Streptomyces sp. SID7499 TaxID=2706086 RepID=A0A6G3XZR1_9ACTN|nr:hypothetical protein [Streptomyces sp. SID7499]